MINAYKNNTVFSYDNKIPSLEKSFCMLTKRSSTIFKSLVSSCDIKKLLKARLNNNWLKNRAIELIIHYSKCTINFTMQLFLSKNYNFLGSFYSDSKGKNIL